jgi:hypothetical protein
MEWQDFISDVTQAYTGERHDLCLEIKDLQTSNTIRAINADTDLRRQREQASWDEDTLVAGHEHQL